MVFSKRCPYQMTVAPPRNRDKKMGIFPECFRSPSQTPIVDWDAPFRRTRASRVRLDWRGHGFTRTGASAAFSVAPYASGEKRRKEIGIGGGFLDGESEGRQDRKSVV